MAVKAFRALRAFHNSSTCLRAVSSQGLELAGPSGLRLEVGLGKLPKALLKAFLRR